MKFVLLILALIPAGLQAQNLSLPVWVIDSLLYETKLSRQCSIALDSQTVAFEKQGLELIETGTALKLYQSKSSTLQDLLDNQKQQRETDGKQAELDKKVLKDKVKRRNKVILAEALGILVLILLI